MILVWAAWHFTAARAVPHSMPHGAMFIPVLHVYIPHGPQVLTCMPVAISPWTCLGRPPLRHNVQGMWRVQCHLQRWIDDKTRIIPYLHVRVTMQALETCSCGPPHSKKNQDFSLHKEGLELNFQGEARSMCFTGSICEKDLMSL